ncbi:MAG: hypothetical protein JEZ00_02235 [Anaerolineaceae bacterium]|nr:hypothetical protein [Anaerolineaceae bacterium]
MLHKRIILFLFIMIFSFSACSPDIAENTTSTPPQIIKIGLSPTLAYLKDPIAVCANQDADYDILLLEKNSLDWIQESVDLIFTVQFAVPNVENTYLVDELEIKIIASQDISLNGLQIHELQEIFNTEMVNPQAIGIPDSDTPLTIWGFENGSDMAGLFKTQYGFVPQLPVDAYLAVSPQSVIEQINDTQHSVGYTLSSVINDQVKVLPVAIEQAAPPIPVIASFMLPPSGTQQALIRCLQASPAE